MKIVILTIACVFIGAASAVKHYYPVTYNNLGCWRDTAKETITTREGDPTLDGNYKTRANAIAKCARVARSHGDDVFALQDGGWCTSSPTARNNFRKYGPSTACKADGKGGSYANQVYEINSIAKVYLEDLGCWSDIENYRAIPTLEELDPVLNGNFTTRKDAIAKCVQAGHARGYTVIALQDGGWCAGSRDAEHTYRLYGPSTNCKSSGKGGLWANQVYRIEVVKYL